MNAPPSRPARAPRDSGHYQPLTRRRRLWLVALAVVTAVTVILTLLDPPGGVQRPRGAEASNTGASSAGADGAAGNSVGGRTEVLPRPPPASR